MAGGKVTSPTGTAPDRYVYYPGTEELGADEIRVIACGTGMPTARRSQAAASWLVELGNGDKFIVDLGSGSMANIQSLMIPANFLTRIFLTHLHTDHWADLTSIWAGGWTAGRSVPLAAGPPDDQFRSRYGDPAVHAKIWVPNMLLSTCSRPTIGTT